LDEGGLRVDRSGAIAQQIFEDGASLLYKVEIDRLRSAHPRLRDLKVLEGYSHTAGRKLTFAADADGFLFSEQRADELLGMLASLAQLLRSDPTAATELLLRAA
jgi:hypothetical protein